MKISNYIFKNHKSIIPIILGISFVMVVLFFNSCKEEEILSNDDFSLSSRIDMYNSSYELLGVSCFPDSIFEVCDSFPSLDSMLITLTDYPGCSFWIQFEYYECSRDSFTFYHLGNFQLISHNCAAFTAAFNSALAAGGATLAAFVENFDHDVYLAIKTGLANAFVRPGTNPCRGAYSTFLSYIRVSCFKWCYIQSGSTVSSRRVACGSDCCTERTTACLDDHGNLVLQTTYDQPYPPHCDGPIIFGTGAPILCTSQSSCDYDCPQ